MKKYILQALVDDRYEVVGQYGTEEADILEFFIKQTNPERLLQVLEENQFGEIEYGNIELRWSRESNGVVVELTDYYDPFGDPNNKRDDFFVMKYVVFIDFLKKWIELQQNKSFEIYVIQNNDGSVVIQDKLGE